MSEVSKFAQLSASGLWVELSDDRKTIAIIYETGGERSFFAEHSIDVAVELARNILTLAKRVGVEA